MKKRFPLIRRMLIKLYPNPSKTQYPKTPTPPPASSPHEAARNAGNVAPDSATAVSGLLAGLNFRFGGFTFEFEPRIPLPLHPGYLLLAF